MLNMFLAIYVQAFLPLCILLAIAAWLWGGNIERCASWAFVTSMALAKLTQGYGYPMYSAVEWSVAVLDALLVLVFFGLSFRNTKTWLLVATALQLLSALAHLARMIDVEMSRLAYAILTGTGGYPILILLAAGIVGKARPKMRTRSPVATD